MDTLWSDYFKHFLSKWPLHQEIDTYYLVVFWFKSGPHFNGIFILVSPINLMFLGVVNI
jgi:hypothetical protein